MQLNFTTQQAETALAFVLLIFLVAVPLLIWQANHARKGGFVDQRHPSIPPPPIHKPKKRTRAKRKTRASKRTSMRGQTHAISTR